MTSADFFDALTAPLRSLTTLVVLVTFFGLLALVRAAGPFGLWLAVAVVPALFRYLVMIAEARAAGRAAAPPGIEYFSLAGNLWTLFPVLPAVLIAQGLELIAPLGAVASLLFAAAALCIFPAMMGVLVLTHAPLEALNPMALLRFMKATSASYPSAAIVALVIAAVPYVGAALPSWLNALLTLALAFSLFSVVGELIARHQLQDEVDIPAPREPAATDAAAGLARARTAILNHAYGFASRGNRQGALQHIEDGLHRDPDPLIAQGWYFDRMLQWEDPMHALVFGQHYLHALLAAGEQVRAVKVLLRGRLVDERFRPLPDDTDAAIAAARACHNDELADALQRR